MLLCHHQSRLSRCLLQQEEQGFVGGGYNRRFNVKMVLLLTAEILQQVGSS